MTTPQALDIVGIAVDGVSRETLIAIAKTLSAEVRRLREENERLKSTPPQSLSSIPPDCRTCANRGHTNGLSQETYCDGCVWYGAYWKKNHYNPIPEPAP